MVLDFLPKELTAQEIIDSCNEIDWVQLNNLVELDDQLDSSKYITS